MTAVSNPAPTPGPAPASSVAVTAPVFPGRASYKAKAVPPSWDPTTPRYLHLYAHKKTGLYRMGHHNACFDDTVEKCSIEFDLVAVLDLVPIIAKEL